MAYKTAAKSTKSDADSKLANVCQSPRSFQ